MSRMSRSPGEAKQFGGLLALRVSWPAMAAPSAETFLPRPDLQLLKSYEGVYHPPGSESPFRLTRQGAILHAANGRTGLAMPWAGRLVVVWGPPAKTEIGAYLITGGRVLGLWVPPEGPTGDGYDGCGRERSDLLPDGTWRIVDAVAIDGSSYQGIVRRTAYADGVAGLLPVEMVWQLADGEFRSFGLDGGGAVYSTFCFEDAPHSLGVYDATTLAGVVVDSGRVVRREVLRRQP